MTELGAHDFACPGTKISMRTLESTQDPEPMAIGSHQSQRKRAQLFGLLGLETVYELVQVAVIMRGGHLIRVRPGPRSWNSAERNSWQETVDPPDGARDTGRVVRGRVPRADGPGRGPGRRHPTRHGEGSRQRAGRTGSVEAEAAQGTREAIRGGADVIYQGVLLGDSPDGGTALLRRPDFLVQAELLEALDGEPRLGELYYEFVDAKLASTSQRSARM